MTTLVCLPWRSSAVMGLWFGHYKVTKNIANVLIIKQLFLINFHRTHVILYLYYAIAKGTTNPLTPMKLTN